MTPPAEHPPRDRADTAFVERLAAYYAPPPLTPSRRAAFDAALQARLEKRQRVWSRLTPTLAAGMAAAVLALSLSGRFGLDSRTPASHTQAGLAVVTQPAHRDTWEDTGLALNAVSDEEEGAEDDNTLFPDDYLAIESAFLKG